MPLLGRPPGDGNDYNDEHKDDHNVDYKDDDDDDCQLLSSSSEFLAIPWTLFEVPDGARLPFPLKSSV